ncbi:MAG: GNAT family N-acetyltransferase, partial [Chloroflexota bacterium]
GLMSQTSDFSQMRGLLGFRGALRAALVLAVGEHKPAPDELYLDGIAVAASARGHGIGSRLLDEVATIGREGGYRRVYLQVVDVNPRAQQLYERRGYRVTDVKSFGFMRRFVGFGGVASMEQRLADDEAAPG